MAYFEFTSFMPKRSTSRPALARDSAEIRDPVHGYVYANELERKIIDTPTFQRLRRIRQLAGCHLVYPGGQHTRFDHSIGAMHLAGIVSSVLRSKRPNFVSEQDEQTLRLAALLHDVGHGPFSHVFEEVMAERGFFTHEQMTQKVITGTEIGDILASYGFSKREIADLATAESGKKSKKFANDVIGGGLSVDIMDYLLRDSYFTGVEYGKVDVKRIVNSFDITENGLAIGQASLFAFEALMIARYEMFRAVYFHRTVRAAELMVIKAMMLSDKLLHFTDVSSSLGRYLSLTDEVTLDQIKNLRDHEDPEIRKARQLADDYDRRKLVKCVFEQTVQRKDKFLASVFKDRGFRDQFASRIAAEAGIAPDDVYIDVPTAPSVPISSSRGSFNQVTVTKGVGKGSYKQSLASLPLLSNIAGFMDIVRVYTEEKYRKRAEIAAKRVFGSQSFESVISM